MDISLQRYRSTEKFKNSFRRRLVSSRTLIPGLLLASLIVFACLHIWQRVYVLSLIKEVSKLEKEQAGLTDLLKKTNTEIVDLSRLSRVESVVSQQLGLTRASAQNIFTLVVKKPEIRKDGLDNVVSSLKKLADNLPVITESKAADTIIFENHEH